VLVAVSKGMRAVSICTNKILHFLTVGAGTIAQVVLYNGHKTVVVEIVIGGKLLPHLFHIIVCFIVTADEMPDTSILNVSFLLVV